MTLAASGAISFYDLNVELGLSGTAQVSFNDSDLRSFLGKDTGAISLDDAHGRSQASITIGSDQYNYDIYTAVVNAGKYSSGKTRVVATIDGGVVVGSTSTGSYALTIQSFTSGDTVRIVNNGYIIGMGGKGGRGDGGSGYNRGSASGGTDGDPGGNAIYANFPATIVNNGIIAGGGGGGGGGGPGSNTGGKSRGPIPSGSGGGGAGRNVGPGGDAPIASEGTRNPGSDGSLLTGGAPSSNSSSGGYGGDAGQPGASPYHAGGSAGYYVVGGTNITWSTVGDLRGNAG